MTSHLGLMVVFSLFVSVVFAALMRDSPAEQFRFGLRLLGGFIGAGILIGWLLYPLPLQEPAPISSRTISLWAPVVIVMLAIYVVSGWSEAPLPRGMSDISGHALAYGGLAALVVRALSRGFPARVTAAAAAGAWLIAVAYGASDELHQMFVPGRTAEMKDLVSDATGALIGIAACWAWGILWVRSDV